MNRTNCRYLPIIQRRPVASAVLSGSEKYPDIRGIVMFYTAKDGMLVYADVGGLPHSTNRCAQKIFGFHIHSGKSCTGNSEDPFADAGAHLNNANCTHPFHTGDMPPLFENDGHAVTVFLTNRFTIGEVIGKAVIIHGSPDDFTSQPGGNSGAKIACGIIKRVC